MQKPPNWQRCVLDEAHFTLFRGPCAKAEGDVYLHVVEEAAVGFIIMVSKNWLSWFASTAAVQSHRYRHFILFFVVSCLFAGVPN
jgi:hypothetical protein